MEVREILHAVPFFKSLSEENIEEVVGKLEFKIYPPNVPVCKVNEPGDKMFIIISGNVKIGIPDGTGGEQIVAQSGAGNFFGEMALLTEEPRTASVTTTINSEMFILHKAQFDEIIETFPGIQIEMSKIMSKRLKQNLNKANELMKAALASGKNIEQKTASGKFGPDKTIVDIMGFCDSKSLSGDIEITSGGKKGVIQYSGGQIVKMVAGSKVDDEALDEILTWEEGTFIIKPREVSFDDLVGKTDSKPDSKNAIVVSTSMVVRKLLERKLTEMGYSVYPCKSIDSAKNLLSQHKPSLVITDTKFEDGSANQLGALIRKDFECPIVIIADGKLPDEIQAFVNNDKNCKASHTHDISEITKIVEAYK
jgi:CRP-like cAMP-binding protein/CheY-like chemotaxis protein